MKEYLKWHNLKNGLDKKKKLIYFYEKEIWFCAIGKNIGHEQNGKNDNFERPVLIIEKFNKFLFLGIPLSSQKKEGLYYFSFEFKGKKSTALLSQIRLWSSNRLVRRFGRIRSVDYRMLVAKLKNIF